MITIFCEECDAIIATEDEASTPVMLLTGCVDTGNKKYYTCQICGHKQIDKDSLYRTG